MHFKSRLFSLVGRRIVLNTPFLGNVEGKIVKKVGPMWFDVEVITDEGPITFNCPRSNFHLPPLDKWDRRPQELSDCSDGFVYEGVEGF